MLFQNRFYRRLCPAILVSIFSLELLSGCAVPAKKQTGDGSGHLFTISLPANPKSLDPQIATDRVSKTIIENLYEGLIELDENGQPVEAAAASYTVSPDGLTYSFTLKEDRYWFFDENENDVVDDGESWQVTAADYVYAFRRIFDPNTQSPYAQRFSCIAGGKAALEGNADAAQIGVYAKSDTQLEFTLESPCAEFLSLLASTAAMPCNETFFLQTKGKYGLDQRSVASCGGFYLRLWFYDPYGKDNLIYMRRSSLNVKGRAVYPANLTFQIRNSDADVAADFEAGASDVLTTSIWKSAYSDPQKYTVTESRSMVLGLVFNPEVETYANENIRKGLSMAIDRSAIGTESEGDIIGASAVIPPAVHSGGKSYRDLCPENDLYDMEKAVETFQKGMEELHMQSIDTTKILVCPTLMNCEHLHDIIQTWQEVFGFYIGIEEVSESDYWKRMENKSYTIAVCAVSGTEDSPASVLNQFRSGNNAFYYQSKRVEALLDLLPACANDDQLRQQCDEIEQVILNEALFVPIFYKNQYCITASVNCDIGFDPFSGALNFRDAKNFS